jgi:hypothetical protein
MVIVQEPAMSIFLMNWRRQHSQVAARKARFRMLPMVASLDDIGIGSLT